MTNIEKIRALDPAGDRYTTPPPAQPAPGMFTAEEVREAYREGYSDWQHGRRILEADWRISMTFKLIKDRT